VNRYIGGRVAIAGSVDAIASTLLGADRHTLGSQRQRDGAVAIGAPDRDGRQVRERRGMRMAVAVVPAERRHRSHRADGVEEPLRIGRPAVVGDLEHLGTQAARAVQQRLLSQRVAVAGQQHAAVGTGDA
jgi:hypothetical protein